MIAIYDLALLFGLALWIGLTAYYLSKPYASIIHPFTAYSFFHGIIFVIRPALACYRDYDALYALYQFHPSLSDKLTVLFAADLGFVCFFLAINRFGNLAFENLRPNRIAAPPKLSRGLIIMLLIVVPLASYILYDTMGARGAAVRTMVQDRATGIVINTVSNGYRDNLHQMLIPVVLLFAWMGRFRLVSLLPVAAFVVAQASTGSRWPFVVAILGTASLYVVYRGSRWINIKLLTLFTAAWLVFSLAVMDRGSRLRDFLGFQTVSYSQKIEGSRLLESMDYGNLEFFEYLVYVIPQRSGTYDYFLVNLQLFTEPVPRVLWSNKPIGAPIQLLKLWDYGRPIGITYSLPGAGWYQAGWLGVMAWCSFFGAIFGWFYNWFVKNSHNQYAVMIYVITYALALQFFRDGMLMTVGKMLLFPLIPILLWAFCVQLFDPKRVKARRQRRSAPDPSAQGPARAALLPSTLRRRRLALAREAGATLTDGTAGKLQ